MDLRFLPAILFLALCAGNSASAQTAARGPVLVELFTSQGCNSCPPADAYLGELTKRGDVLALAFHVDYWDRLGWKDPFSARAWTDRQRAYAATLGASNIYTPQMVVSGSDHAVGSDRRAVEALIARAPVAAGPELQIARSDAGLSLKVEGVGEGEIWLVGFDPVHETKVARGENAGKTLREFNVVRGMVRAADWTGGDLARNLARDALPEGEALVAVLQAPGPRRVLAVSAVLR
jgi:hypothetical protein